MAATILNSRQAVDTSIYVVRAFVKLRELLSSNRVLARKLDELEERLTKRLDDPRYRLHRRYRVAAYPRTRLDASTKEPYCGEVRRPKEP
jgi:hypothetical protein